MRRGGISSAGAEEILGRDFAVEDVVRPVMVVSVCEGVDEGPRTAHRRLKRSSFLC
jgi:hypothetical protein